MTYSLKGLKPDWTITRFADGPGSAWYEVPCVHCGARAAAGKRAAVFSVYGPNGPVGAYRACSVDHLGHWWLTYRHDPEQGRVPEEDWPWP